MDWASLISAIPAIMSAMSSNDAKKEAEASASAYNENLAAQIGTVEGNIQSLYDSQSDPTELFAEIFAKYPDMLSSILPSLTTQAIDTSGKITQSNIDNFKLALGQLYPQYDKYTDARTKTIDSLNPDNLGQEEIKAQTRMLSPLIPAGTLDPKTGAVAGGTTSPVSLYRNLVSGLYNDRRTQYLGEVKSYLSDAENSAARQQSGAESFLMAFLEGAHQTSGSLTSSTLGQEAQNEANQYSLLKTLLGIPLASVDSTKYDQATSAAIGQAVSGLGTAFAGYNQSSQAKSGAAKSATTGGGINISSLYS